MAEHRLWRLCVELSGKAETAGLIIDVVAQGWKADIPRASLQWHQPLGLDWSQT